MCEEEVSPRYVVCHPLSRDRYGGSGFESLEILSQIAETGFSQAAMAHAIMEAGPYTHLTLPTNRIVWFSCVACALDQQYSI